MISRDGIVSVSDIDVVGIRCFVALNSVNNICGLCRRCCKIYGFCGKGNVVCSGDRCADQSEW